MTALMTATMMVAMMLPSLAPALWCYHRQLRTAETSRAGERTVLFAVGYTAVWSAVSLLLFAISASPLGLTAERSTHTTMLSLGPAVIVLCAGALQRSQWKTRQLARCRQPLARSTQVIAACRDGCRLGVDCVMSCAAPMAVLLVAGLMNVQMMMVVTAAITAERVMPAGARIARLTGTIALVAGVVMCMRGA